MRKVLNLFGIALLLLSACDQPGAGLKAIMNDPASGLHQEKRVGNTVVSFTYLPACWERVNGRSANEGATEMCFKVNVFSPGNSAGMRKKDAQGASYGLDSVFQLVLNHDTLAPLQAQRIANGNMKGIEYLVIFERRPLSSVQAAAFIYKDWLFTSTRLVFPLQKNYLQKSDSISCRL
ncbi:hypothetical protein QFZ51_003375 [Chitinophaga sp. W3I9]|uniref:hypothetical protein n=1 Tax=unclassified Chitinophaga TaxID=2619133 RepID=UPI003D25964D